MTPETPLSPPVLETLIDLRPPELEKPTDVGLLMALGVVSQRESVYADASGMENLLPRSLLYSALRDSFAADVFVKRLAYHAPKARLSDGVVVFVGLVSEGSPGKAVQWAHAVAKACHLLDTESTGSLTFDQMMVEYFRDGLPTSAGYRRIWEAQKRPREHQLEHKGSDNWLDFSPEVWDFSREQAPLAASPA